jgi:HlyD family secretion protein
MSSLMPRMPRTGPRKTATDSGPNKQVWVLEAGAAKAAAVTTGITDGRMTEITGGELKAGMQIITDQRTGAAP